MNPETNKFEKIVDASDDEVKRQIEAAQGELKKHYKSILRANGSPVPTHWSLFKETELVVIKNYTFRVKCIGESYILLEPVKPENILTEKK